MPIIGKKVTVARDTGLFTVTGRHPIRCKLRITNYVKSYWVDFSEVRLARDTVCVSVGNENENEEQQHVSTVA